ncbi:MAG: hypothetical protein ACYC1K_00065 [Minisyncoccota bacterium]
MTTHIERPGAIGILPVYTYLNFDARFLAANKFFLPAWLKAKTVANSVTKNPQTTSKPDLKLFEGKVVDVLTLLEDFAKEGRRPSHIHMMNREHRGVRVRISWFKGGDVLSGAEIDWITNVIGRFFWDAKSYKRTEASEHLPPHVSVHIANPVERDQDTSVFSIQLIEDEPSLINDPS